MQPARHAIRLKGYDYTQSGYYFITICTQNRESLFGHIVGATRGSPTYMELNDVGQMMKNWWNKIPNKYPHVILDKYQIMPNHIHGIIKIVGADPCVRPLPHPCVRPNIISGLIGSTHGSTPTLGNEIQWFKTMVTNEYIRRIKSDHWPSFDKRLFQRNFYEHIIRNEEELHIIRKYIEDNPSMWERDRNNPNL